MKEQQKEWRNQEPWVSIESCLWDLRGEQTNIPSVMDEIYSLLFSKSEVLRVIEGIDKILLDELTLSHTTKSGKTSRLTSAINRIEALRQALHL